MKKWTKAERAEASRKGKERWAARKKRDVRSTDWKNTMSDLAPKDSLVSITDRSDVVRATLLLYTSGYLTSVQVVEIVDRMFQP